jgi:glucose-fructose oxidoreductase
MGGLGDGLMLTSLESGVSAAPSRKIGYAIVGLDSYATRQIMPNFSGCDAEPGHASIGLGTVIMDAPR